MNAFTTINITVISGANTSEGAYNGPENGDRALVSCQASQVSSYVRVN